MEKEKLKTLKNMRRFYHNDNYATIAEHELKAEAIKWIKSINSLEKTELDEAWDKITGNKTEYSTLAKEGMNNFIKYFFNITEEELG